METWVAFLHFFFFFEKKKHLKYVSDNCYFKFGIKIFKKITGATKLDSIPFMANQFLYYYKNTKSTKRSNCTNARIFSNP